MAIIDPFDFLEFCGASGHGFVADFTIPKFIQKVLEIGECKDTVEKLAKLDQVLPVHQSGDAHPLFWICLMWLESMGLIERADGEGGLANFELEEAGVYVLQALREREAGFQ